MVAVIAVDSTRAGDNRLSVLAASSQPRSRARYLSELIEPCAVIS